MLHDQCKHHKIAIKFNDNATCHCETFHHDACIVNTIAEEKNGKNIQLKSD